eukprot:scaffold16707_cov182-Amphora_coffeaeformis.AAC.9
MHHRQNYYRLGVLPNRARSSANQLRLLGMAFLFFDGPSVSLFHFAHACVERTIAANRSLWSKRSNAGMRALLSFPFYHEEEVDVKQNVT